MAHLGRPLEARPLGLKSLRNRTKRAPWYRKLVVSILQWRGVVHPGGERVDGDVAAGSDGPGVRSMGGRRNSAEQGTKGQGGGVPCSNLAYYVCRAAAEANGPPKSSVRTDALRLLSPPFRVYQTDLPPPGSESIGRIASPGYLLWGCSASPGGLKHRHY